MTTPTEPTRLPVQVGTDIQQGPDGQPWVKLQLSVGVTIFGMLVPEATAAELGPLIAEQLAVGAANARRARTGLIIASPNMPTMPPTNGKLPPQLRQPGRG
jgi:hypothetical protein